MKMFKPVIPKLVLCLFLWSFFVAWSVPEKDTIAKPNFILFKLNRSENKIQALKDRNRTEDIKTLQRYDQQIATAIMKDFNNNFKFCKVYFFNSPQLHDVIEGNWDKVILFDTSLNVAVKPNISPKDDYFIVENNFPPPPGVEAKNTKSKESQTSNRYDGNFINSHDEFGIVSYDKQYKLLPHKICYSRANMASKIFRKKKLQQFEFEYLGAGEYSKSLNKYFD